MDEQLPHTEPVNLPELLGERQSLVDQLAGTYAIPIYSSASNGTSITETHNAGEDFTTYNQLPQESTTLEGVVMPTGVLYEWLVLARNSFEMTLIKKINRTDKMDSLIDKATFDYLAQGILLSKKYEPLLTQNLITGWRWNYQVTDSSEKPDTFTAKIDETIAFSKAEQQRLFDQRAKAASQAHAHLRQLFNSSSGEPASPAPEPPNPQH